MIRRNGQVLGSVFMAGLNTPEPVVVERARDNPAPVPPLAPLEPPDPVGDSVPASDGTGLPKHYANKPEWVDYAVNHAPVGKRLSVDDANELSKSELIELFGGQE